MSAKLLYSLPCLLFVIIILLLNQTTYAQVEITTDESSLIPNQTQRSSQEPTPIVLNTAIWNNHLGSSIAGEILNNFSTPIKSPQVSTSVYDKNGIIIATANSYISDDQINSGEKSGFRIDLEDRVPKESKYVITPSFEKSDNVKLKYLELNLGKKSKDSLRL